MPLLGAASTVHADLEVDRPLMDIGIDIESGEMWTLYWTAVHTPTDLHIEELIFMNSIFIIAHIHMRKSCNSRKEISS